MKITFDSNVWRIVTSPATFPKEQALSSFQIINQQIRLGHLQGFLSETVFTLEAIKKVDRRKLITEYNPPFKIQETIQDGVTKLSISIEPDRVSHPGNNSYLTTHLNDALQLGFKLLWCPRMAWIANPGLQRDWFIELAEAEISPYQEVFGAVVTEIKKHGCGSHDLEAIGRSYAIVDEHWTEGIKNAPALEDRTIAKAFAEWADADAIAAHIAYNNHYFCTRDIAKNAGSRSVLSEENRTWLEKEYAIKFITPEGLAQILTT